MLLPLKSAAFSQPVADQTRRTMHRTFRIAHFQLITLALAISLPARAERINHEGRISGRRRWSRTPTLFNTPRGGRGRRRDADHAGDERVE